eukprot:scaffold48446_cov68-Phaeocystis_antarctica.AAC.2
MAEGRGRSACEVLRSATHGSSSRRWSWCVIARCKASHAASSGPTLTNPNQRRAPAPWARGGSVWHARRPRRAFSADSTT